MLCKNLEPELMISVSELPKYEKLLVELGYTRCELASDNPKETISYKIGNIILCQIHFCQINDKFALTIVPLEITEKGKLRCKSYKSTMFNFEMNTYYYNLVNSEHMLRKECYKQQKIIKRQKEQQKLYNMRKDFV